ncbi:hypothetical protein BKA82DRAFT_4180404, partial [Pisolithus tinctorius]
HLLFVVAVASSPANVVTSLYTTVVRFQARRSNPTITHTLTRCTRHTVVPHYNDLFTHHAGNTYDDARTHAR